MIPNYFAVCITIDNKKVTLTCNNKNHLIVTLQYSTVNFSFSIFSQYVKFEYLQDCCMFTKI